MSNASPGFRIRVPLQLAKDEVLVWIADLDSLASVGGHWLGLLSADEQERAQRFRFAKHRSRFAVTRGLLRTLLASYLTADPRSLCFRYSHKNKPALDAAWADSQIQFNVSHSENVALLAFTLARDIGVDVERVRWNFDVNTIAQRFFSSSEKDSLAALPASQRHEAFFNCWTRKEAFIKAVGEGLSLPLDQFDVSLAPGQAARLLATRPDPEERTHWSMWALDAVKEYAAAVVARGSNLRLATGPISSIMEFETK